MSVFTLSHFAAHLALDFDQLAAYASNPQFFLPEGDDDEETASLIIQKYGDMTGAEIEAIRSGDFNTIFTQIQLSSGTRPIQDDPPG